MRFADLGGVTVDAFGTLVRLRDPVGKLTRLTRRDPESVAFQAEVSSLDRVGVEAGRALQIGDSEANELGATAAGLRFAAVPLPRAVAALV